MSLQEKIRIGDLLLQKGLISGDQLEFALKQQQSNGRKLGRVLVDNGFITEKKLSEALAKQLDLRYINLKNYPLNLALVRLLPESQARRFRAIVLEVSNGILLIGMAEPTDLSAFDEISRIVKCGIEVAVVTEGQLLECFDRGYRRSEETLVPTSAQPQKSTSATVVPIDTRRGESAALMQFLQELLDEAARVGASDIYLESQTDGLLLRYRVDGSLHRYEATTTVAASALLQRLKQLCNLDVVKDSCPQQGYFRARSAEREIKVRVNTCPTQHGEAVAMQLLCADTAVGGLDMLGMSSTMLARVRRLIARPSGMIVFTGLAASGKSATLYAALAAMDAVGRKIIAIDGALTQVPANVSLVGTDRKVEPVSVVTAQQADVLLLSPLEQAEFGQAALDAATSGSLVLTQFTAKNAATALAALLEKMPRVALASTLSAVIAQCLLRQVCAHCAERYVPNPEEKQWLQRAGIAADQCDGVMQGRGCTHCHGSGYRGQLAVYELLEMRYELTDAAIGGNLAEVMRVAKQVMQGKTMLAQALTEMQQGKTSLSEVMRCAQLSDTQC